MARPKLHTGHKIVTEPQALQPVASPSSITLGPAGTSARPEVGALWTSSEGQVANIGVYAICALTFWLVLPLLYAAYRALQSGSRVYILTDQRLFENSGILMRTSEALELYRVKDISVQRPLLQRLIGRGRVVLLTSDRSTPEVILNAIENPLVVADMVRECVEHCRVAKGVREFDR